MLHQGRIHRLVVKKFDHPLLTIDGDQRFGLGPPQGAPASGHDAFGCVRAKLFGKLALATEGSIGMHLDQAIVAHQEHLAVLAKAEVVDQLR